MLGTRQEVLAVGSIHSALAEVKVEEAIPDLAAAPAVHVAEAIDRRVAHRKHDNIQRG